MIAHLFWLCTQRPVLAAVLSGCLASAAFPKLQWSLLAFVSLAPFLAILVTCKTQRQAAKAGFSWGCAFFATLIYWIPEVMINFGHLDKPTAYIIFAVLVAILSLYPVAFALAFHPLSQRHPKAWWFAAPCLWLSVEWVRTLWPFGGFPWGQIGYALVPHLGIMQLSSWTGIYGVTFLVVLFNASLAFWLQKAGTGTPAKLPLLFGAAAVSVIWTYGNFHLANVRDAKTEGAGLHVCILQGNIPFENDLSQARKIFQNFYYPETASAFRNGAAIVLWPESPTPYSYLMDPDYQKLVQSLCRQGRGALVLSDITFVGKEGYEEYYNSALFLNEQGTLAGRYDKHLLVPYGEYVPLADLLGFADALTREVSAFHAGRDAVVVPLKGYAVGAFICYESIFPQWIRGFTRQGAQWLVNLTNDSWYGNTAAPWQHLQMAMVRAIENRRYLVRAANSGISAVIAPSGEIVGQLGLFAQGILRAEIRHQEFTTFYVLAGDFLPMACAIISVLWIASCLRMPSSFRKNA